MSAAKQQHIALFGPPGDESLRPMTEDEVKTWIAERGGNEPREEEENITITVGN